MGKMAVDYFRAWQEKVPVYSLKAKREELSSNVEAFDIVEYDKNNLNSNLIKIVPDYAQMSYYTDIIAPLIYENTDVESLVGDYNAPTSDKVVILSMDANGLTLNKNDLQIGSHIQKISKYGAVSNYMQLFMNTDFIQMSTKLSNVLVNSNNRKAGVEKLLQTDEVPWFLRGNYPMIFQYTLPGKNIVTTSHVVNVTY